MMIQKKGKSWFVDIMARISKEEKDALLSWLIRMPFSVQLWVILQELIYIVRAVPTQALSIESICHRLYHNKP